MTKQGRSGKLAEPTTLQMTTKLVEAAKNTFGNEGVLIGVEKIDNNGNMKYTSTGLKTPISPWKERSSSVISDVYDGMNQPYVCFYPRSSGQLIWHDCDDSISKFSVCEF